MAFQPIRDEETGALLARYDPVRHRLEIKSEQTRGRVVERDLPARVQDATKSVDAGGTNRVR